MEDIISHYLRDDDPAKVDGDDYLTTRTSRQPPPTCVPAGSSASGELDFGQLAGDLGCVGQGAAGLAVVGISAGIEDEPGEIAIRPLLEEVGEEFLVRHGGCPFAANSDPNVSIYDYILHLDVF